MVTLSATAAWPVEASELAATGTFLRRIHRHLTNGALSAGDRAALEALEMHASEHLPNPADTQKWEKFLVRYDRAYDGFAADDLESVSVDLKAAVMASPLRFRSEEGRGSPRLVLEQARGSSQGGQEIDRAVITFSSAGERGSFVKKLSALPLSERRAGAWPMLVGEQLSAMRTALRRVAFVAAFAGLCWLATLWPQTFTAMSVVAQAVLPFAVAASGVLGLRAAYVANAARNKTENAQRRIFEDAHSS